MLFCRKMSAWFFRGAIFVSLGVLSCAPSKKQVRKAQSSNYDTEFSRVYASAVDVVQKRYPNFIEDPRKGEIKTKWHSLRIRDSQGVAGRSNARRPNASSPTATNQNGGTGVSTNQPLQHHFVRFDIKVHGGRPWKVTVKGEASKWIEGDVPTPLRGGDEPAWLQGRVDTLRVAIHSELADYARAVPPRDSTRTGHLARSNGSATATTKRSAIVPVEIPDKISDEVKDPQFVHCYKNLRQSLENKDMAGVTVWLAKDFSWETSLDHFNRQASIALWGVDTAFLAHMSEAMKKKCIQNEDKTVTCFSSRHRMIFARSPQGDWRLHKLSGQHQ